MVFTAGTDRRLMVNARGVLESGITDPSELPSPLAWWRADLGWSSPNWTDQINSWVLSGTNTPTQNATGGPNSTAEIECQSGDVLECTEAGLAYAGKHIFWVMVMDVASGFVILSNAASGTGQLYSSGAPRLMKFSSGNEIDHGSTIAGATYYIIELWHSTTDSHMRIFNSSGELGSQKSETVGVGTPTGLELPITGSAYSMSYAEILFHTGELTGSDYTDLMAYFGSRYGFSNLPS